MIKENELKESYIDLLHKTDMFIKEINQQIWELTPSESDTKQWQRKHDKLVKKLERWGKIKNVLSSIILDLVDYKSLEVH